MGFTRQECRILAEETPEKQLLGVPKRGWQNHIRTDYTHQDVNRIEVIRDSVHSL
jgi:hypothetical protein